MVCHNLSFIILLLGCCCCATIATTIEVDVLVLGAGMSGITAAAHLQDGGLKNFLVLEAQDYVGGRWKNLSFGGVTFGAGPNWIHYVEDGADNPILQLANKLKLSKGFQDSLSVVIKNLENGAVKFNETVKDLEEAAGKVTKDVLADPPCKDTPASSALHDEGWDPDTVLKKSVEWLFYDFEYAVKTSNISTRHFTGIPEENAFVIDPRGFASIIHYMAQNFTNKIKLNTIVTEIKYGSDGVEVKTNNGDIYKANYTLCTFSTGVLGSNLVKFQPTLPAWKTEAIEYLPLAYYTHVLVKFSEAFWDNDVDFLIEGGKSGGKYPAIYNMNNKKYHPGSNILYLPAIGEYALRVENQAEDKTVDEVVETLQAMYPKKNVSRPTDVFISHWSKNPYVRGSFSNANVGTQLAHFHNLEGRLNNLFFAGEACEEDYWGYLQGAYLSGLRQAKAINSCYQGNTCKAYKAEETKESCTSTAHSLQSPQVAIVYLLFAATIFKLLGSSLV